MLENLGAFVKNHGNSIYGTFGKQNSDARKVILKVIQTFCFLFLAILAT